MSDPKKIVTDYDPKPIPIRNFDWVATRDGYDGGDQWCGGDVAADPSGHGSTKDDAVLELLIIEAGDLEDGECPCGDLRYLIVDNEKRACPLCTPTPGPWQVQNPVETGGLVIKPVPGQIIAQCDQLPNMEANARLIAAAPELLSALKDCLLTIETKWGSHAEPGSVLYAGRIALAKAEGRS